MVCSYYRSFIAAAALATPAMRSSLLFHSEADFIIVAVWSVGRSSQPSATLGIQFIKFNYCGNAKIIEIKILCMISVYYPFAR